jgi:hypothetical protein
MKQEIWKEIEGTEGRYHISNLGRVKSYVMDQEEGRIMRPKLAKNGYILIKLNRHNKYSMHLLHRLVGKAFIPNPDGKKCIDHINKDKRDCKASNLQWIGHKSNVQKDQAYPIQCEHESGKKFIALGTRDAADKTGCARHVIVRNMRLKKKSFSGWTFRRI